MRSIKNASASELEMSQSPCKGHQKWRLLLLLIAIAIALPLPTLAAPTPTSTSTADRRRCAHKGIAELIRSSPVIVKALGARIFSDAELAENATQILDMAAILITLTPETIYKGASLLKMANGAADGAVGGGSGLGSGTRRSNFGGAGSSSAWSGGGGAESAYQYEGQLNATLQPLACFDANMLKMLPMELIAFGKLLPASRQQQQSLPLPATSSADGSDKDVLHISINGLHRWTPQFENHIWKHLGWDDWSDFTLCSVTCGKGVQQRFRRCLLDNPLVGISMNMNLANDDDDDDDDDEDDVETVDVDEADNDVDVATAADEHEYNADNNEVLPSHGDEEELLMMQAAAIVSSSSTTEREREKEREEESTVTQAAELSLPLTLTKEQTDEMLHKFPHMTATSTPSTTYVPRPRTSVGNEAESGVSFVPNGHKDEAPPRARQHKKHKSAKSLSTLLCEGYNIEQRNCNSFECSDDISDLLKFYKRLPAFDELPLATDYSVPLADSNDAGAALAFEAAATVPGATLLQPSSTPSNMGYIRSWRNALNFTLMITLRAKNDTKNTATIFSIRNATHNLYLEACKDGLRLYLERDNTTEMLPVKFHLYDYRWHQVAISIQNGDFISIYVDCSWTNSFVVSKRLFTLPLDADVEIGRGFNGELQQLLLLPEHQERLQCSNKRTSINEVKRYIIDTFIDDYGGN